MCLVGLCPRALQDRGQDVGQEGLLSEGPTTRDLLPNARDCRWGQLVGHTQSCNADLPDTAFPSKAGRGTSLVVQWLRVQAPSAGGIGLIPCQGARIPQAT